MKIPKKPVFFMLCGTAIILFGFLVMQPWAVLYFGSEIDVLFPKGIIGIKERNLLFILQALMLLVIIPVYILTFIFSWKYRAHNPKAKYNPDLVDNTLAEVIWWGIPFIMTIIVAVLTWIETYRLDPFKPLVSDRKPLTVQVVALQWKWLFIYPEQNIASLNFLQIPEKTPIRFEITADAPMNSFWIPQLGGQIYAMPSMKTVLHLIADSKGDFKGYSANISGEGFSSMHFITRASSEEGFEQWVQAAKNSNSVLSFEKFNKLVVPSKDNPPETFLVQDTALFERIVNKYMHPHEK